MADAMTLEEALALVRQLSPVDRARLIERMAPDIERELKAAQSTLRKCPVWRADSPGEILGVCKDAMTAVTLDKSET